MVLSSEQARANSRLLMERAIARRDGFCVPSATATFQQTTSRAIPKAPSWASPPKSEIRKPNICKPNSL